MTWLAMACSGPGAMAAITQNESWAWTFFGVSAVVAAALAIYSLVRKRFPRWLWVTIALVPAHPAVWMNAYGGDCGHMMYFSSIVATVLSLVVATLAVIRPGTRVPAA
jgi:hypothetical protein